MTTMLQRLRVDPAKCTECCTCEMKCTLVHFGLFNPNKSGARILSQWPELPRSRVCRQCTDPACLPACPVEALVRDPGGPVRVLYDQCTGCGACVDACPYDGVWLDPLSQVAVKCDTCNGRFECVPTCAPGALSVEEVGHA